MLLVQLDELSCEPPKQAAKLFQHGSSSLIESGMAGHCLRGKRSPQASHPCQLLCHKLPVTLSRIFKV